MEFLITGIISLFSVVNPLGTAPLFVSLTQDLTKSDLTKIAIKASSFATLALISAFFIGDYILNFFSVSIISLRFSGGIIIGLSGISLLRGNFSSHKGLKPKLKDEAFSKEDPSITPLAFPMLAGPGSISYLITSNQICETVSDYALTVLSIVCVGLLIFLILSSSRILSKRIGTTGLHAMSRVIGFIIITIAVEYLFSAIKMFIEANF